MVKILSFDVGIVNLAYCIFDTTTRKITHWEVIELTAKNFSAKVPSGKASISSAANDIHINLIKALDLRPFLLNVNVVLIEKQPSFNPKMRIIGGCLQSYFYIRGVIDLKEASITSVEFFSPKHKLKCYTGPPIVLQSKVKGKYAQTKKTGIAIAEIKLNEYSEPLTTKAIYNTSKKKDDLSDCYLQALTYATFKKLIPVSGNVNSTLPESGVQEKQKPETKASLKKKMKDFLDSRVKVYSVVELLNNNFGISTLTLADDFNKSLKEKYTFTDLKDLLGQMNMKRYTTFNYQI
jgi:hypothetical protein